MRSSTLVRWPARLVAVVAIGLTVTACSIVSSSSTKSSPVISVVPAPTAANAGSSAAASVPAPSGPTDLPSTGPDASASQPPDTGGGGTTSGDVPDNAIFLTFKGGAAPAAFSIQYVQGWQVANQPDGVIIRDKDSSETVAIVPPQADVPGYVAATDLPALRALAGFKLIKQDSVKVGSTRYVHLSYHLPAPPDPVTGKQVPSTVDRYYVPGPNGLAIVSLSTPDGVDNVDAFRQMIESFKWS